VLGLINCIKAAVTSGNPSLWGSMAFAVRIKQNYKLIPEKSLVGLAVSQYDTDTVEFVQFAENLDRKT
jgi:hypothetical protein